MVISTVEPMFIKIRAVGSTVSVVPLLVDTHSNVKHQRPAKSAWTCALKRELALLLTYVSLPFMIVLAIRAIYLQCKLLVSRA